MSITQKAKRLDNSNTTDCFTNWMASVRCVVIILRFSCEILLSHTILLCVTLPSYVVDVASTEIVITTRVFSVSVIDPSCYESSVVLRTSYQLRIRAERDNATLVEARSIVVD